ncbi:SO2930 family diheme c-type cytochrome [Cecembia rubra]|uniref:Putative repeat protein (TIGR03806 family) n=1 Tax=Cecembia rubra TaxID=1485585 RepID=A0A2P8DLA4_9BACT|nr:SO2930 family diheme c-type cytochrome [Cecembia rubra]PSK97931.1 putative repeat protein (TIGR03806 family) [Cecembia rubra]
MRKKSLLKTLFYSLILFSILECTSKEKEHIELWDASLISDIDLPYKNINAIDLNEIPFDNLSDYGFFQGLIRNLDPVEGVLLYEPASSLFTDYAFKSRFIWLPKGNSITIQNDVEGTFDFPDNTILIKNFYYPVDFSQPEGIRRILETRLLVKQRGTWEAYPYIWKDDQSDAQYKVAGAEIKVHWKDYNGDQVMINYLVPNKNQCKSCHNIHEQLVPIGVKAKYLNHTIVHKEESENQLLKWAISGKLSNYSKEKRYPSMVNYQDTSQPLELRARAYLDINCAHCHRAEAPGSTSGLFLTYEEMDPMKLGILKTPVAAGFGAGSFKFDIVPGKSDQSILTYRMGTNLVGAAMPELGRVSVHQEGLELIKKWIDEM